MNRAYSLLQIKEMDDDLRVITGMASTPQPDRMGDIVEPLGAQFAKEIPLLWQHKHDSPVGIAEFGTPTKAGIPFKATVARIIEEGKLKEMTDMAWQAVKAKLVKGVSIGFRPLSYEYLDQGGVRFSESEIYELSLVTIPANAEATIQTIKSADAGHRKDFGVKLVSKSVNSSLPSGAVRLSAAKK